jgi:hypothetical protein
MRVSVVVTVPAGSEIAWLVVVVSTPDSPSGVSGARMLVTLGTLL